MSSNEEYATLIESFAKRSSHADRANWRRQEGLMTELVDKVRPLEEQILDAMAKKQVHLDEIADLRSKMVHKCIHPLHHLELQDSSPDTHIIIQCKFCESKFTVRKPEED